MPDGKYEELIKQARKLELLIDAMILKEQIRQLTLLTDLKEIWFS